MHKFSLILGFFALIAFAASMLMFPRNGKALLLSGIPPAVTGTFPVKVSGGVLQTAGGTPFLVVGDAPQAATNLPLCAAGQTLALCAPGGVPVSDAVPTNATWVAYLSDRQAQGFNSIWLDALLDNYSGGVNNNGKDNAGNLPFTTLLSGSFNGDTCPENGSTTATPTTADCWDLSTAGAGASAAYWTRLDAIITLAGYFNLNVFLNVIPTDGCNNQAGAGTIGNGASTGSWGLTFLNNYAAASNAFTKITTYGQFLANRYKTFNNIVWLLGNDFICWSTSTTMDNTLYSLAGTLKTTDTNHILTTEIMGFINSLGDTSNTWATYVNLNDINAGGTLYSTTVLATTQNSTAIPPMLIEAFYQGEDGSQDDGTSTGTNITGCGSGATQLGGNPASCPFRERHQFWWNMLSGGSAGFVSGNHFSWQIGNSAVSGWNNGTGTNCSGTSGAGHSPCLDTAANANLKNGAAFLKNNVAWYKLKPDTANATTGARIASPFVTACYGGSCTTNYLPPSGNSNGVTNNFIGSGLASDGSFGMAYVPGVTATCQATPAPTCLTTGLSVTVNNALITGGGSIATAYWIDPSSTMASLPTPICSPSTTACSSGSQTFTTPTTGHSDAYTDWVLFVKSGP